MASACAFTGLLHSGWMPSNGALHGFALDHLMRINLGLVLGCLLAAHLMLIAGVLKRGRPRVHRIRRLLLVEVLGLALLCGMFGWMTISSQRLWANNRFTGSSPIALQVEVIGVQFQWYFRYPGADQSFGKTKPELVDAAAGNPLGIEPSDPDGLDDIVASEMILPAGREVDLRLVSHDVIHGFFIPGMRLKQDAVPGMVLHVHFTPVTPGEYPILCSQLCGLGHGRMQAHLRVVSAKQFAAWLAGREKVRPTTNGAE
jgi:cytochrome c oxidase subunit II